MDLHRKHRQKWLEFNNLDAFALETGLYYYRARYYNPHIGRFMQTDPVGYGYAYCGNNPIGRVDPSGLYWTFLDSWYTKKYELGSGLVFAWVAGGDNIEPDPNYVTVIKEFETLEEWYKWAPEYFEEQDYEDWEKVKQVGWELSGFWMSPRTMSRDSFFWRLQAMRFLSSEVGATINAIENKIGQSKNYVVIYANTTPRPEYGGTASGYKIVGDAVLIEWNPNGDVFGGVRFPGLVGLTHELYHAYDFMKDGTVVEPRSQAGAIVLENRMSLAFYWKVPGWTNLWPFRSP